MGDTVLKLDSASVRQIQENMEEIKRASEATTRLINGQNEAWKQQVKSLNEAAELAKALGNHSEYYASQLAAIQKELDALNNAETKDKQRIELLNTKQRRLQVRASGSISGLFEAGLDDKNFEANEKYLDFFQKDLPTAFSTASDSFGQLVSDTMFGAASLSETWSSLGKIVQDVVQKLVKSFIFVQLHRIIYGIGTAIFGSNANGNVFMHAPLAAR